jgi:hypothetical protein
MQSVRPEPETRPRASLTILAHCTRPGAVHRALGYIHQLGGSGAGDVSDRIIKTLICVLIGLSIAPMRQVLAARGIKTPEAVRTPRCLRCEEGALGSSQKRRPAAKSAQALHKALCKTFLAMLMLKIMQYEATTHELADVLSVTEKTVCEWARSGIMVKLRHGRCDLKQSLANWAAYQRCVFDRVDDPLELWQIRQQVEWAATHPQPPLENMILTPLADLQTFEVRIDALGRVIGDAE